MVQQAFRFETPSAARHKFEQFHRDNPRVYELIARFIGEIREKGFRHYSINSIFERIRWHVDIETRAEDPFKLNNNYRSHYVRKIEQDFPHLKGFFATRTLQNDRGDL
jgi:hypothetical protein